MHESAQFVDAIKSVARALIFEDQPMTVDLSELIRIVVQHFFHPSEFLKPVEPARARSSDDLHNRLDFSHDGLQL